MSSVTALQTAMRPRNSVSASAKSKRKSTSLPPDTVEYLKNWMMSPEHIAHPYPTEQEKAKIMQDTGIELKQLTNWFVNNRKRYWKPRVEARLQEQSKSKDVPCLSLKTSSPTTTTDVPVSVMSKAIAKVISNSSMTSLDTSHQASTTVTPMGSPTRSVVAASASTMETTNNVSDNSSVSSFEDDMVVPEQEHTIRVDLHLLRPVSGDEPTEADMTTLSNIPKERILRSFRDCYITYRIPANATLKEEQVRRDAELMRLKKRFLSSYLEEQAAAAEAAAAAKAAAAAAAAQETKKRRATCALFDAVENVSPRDKFRRVSLDVWKDACKNACHMYDESLPSLEEATQLFGYATNN